MSLPNAYATASSTALPLHVLTHAQFAGWRAQQSPALRGWLDAQGFVAAPGTLALLPGTEGIAGAVIGIGDPQNVYACAHAPHGLPVGDWQLATPLDQAARAASGVQPPPPTITSGRWACSSNSRSCCMADGAG